MHLESLRLNYSNINRVLPVLQRNHFVPLAPALSSDQRRALNQLEVGPEFRQMDCYESTYHDILQNTIDFLQNTSFRKSSHRVTHYVGTVVASISMEVIRGLNLPTAWTMFRLFPKNSDFVVPRWHQDGKYFDSQNKVYKLVVTLRGPTTRFAMAKNLEKFSQLAQQGEQESVRRTLHASVREFSPCPNKEAMIYLVGHPEAVIHSEPDMSLQSRIFLSVLPGSYGQIAQWREKNQQKQRA